MILCVFAMKSEASPFLNEYAFKCIEENKYYELEISSQKIGLLITGVGKVNAAHGLTKVLSQKSVSAIYNFGFVGASQPYQQKELLYVNSTMYHDFDLTAFGYRKGEVPGCPAIFYSDQKLLKEAQDKFTLDTAFLLTGDVFLTQSMDTIFIVDMEGASLYHVAHLMNCPILSIKVVSDVIGTQNHIESYQAFEASQGSKLLLSVFKEILF